MDFDSSGSDSKRKKAEKSLSHKKKVRKEKIIIDKHSKSAEKKIIISVHKKRMDKVFSLPESLRKIPDPTNLHFHSQIPENKETYAQANTDQQKEDENLDDSGDNSYDREMQELLGNNDEQAKNTPDNTSEKAPSNREEAEHNAEFPLNFMRRNAFEVKPDSIWASFSKEKACCQVIYSFVQIAGYALPPYKSKPICVNYCVGVFEKHYFCFNGILKKPVTYKKVRKIIVYYELVRKINKNLGYDSTNLPPFSYLISFLYTIDPAHFLFALPYTKWKMELNPETGLYIIPISCQGFIQSQNLIAHALTLTALKNNHILKSVANAAEVVNIVEEIRQNIARLKKRLKTTPYSEDKLITELKKRIKIK